MTRTRTRARARNRTLGSWGESIALQYLRRQGMVLLERNWRCPSGEIDLVLRDGDVLVVCEVKTRLDLRFGHPLEAIDATKAGRLHLLAALYQEDRGVRPPDVRLDAVGVVLDNWSGHPQIEHVRGIG